jgi:DNA adenine methylase
MSLDGPLRYYGGKKTTAHHIIPRFPRSTKENELGLYVEPFFGGGGVFFQVPPQLYPIQVVNDLNKSIVTFYRVLRTRPDELIQACKLTPYALAEQRDCRLALNDPGLDSEKMTPEDELETARRVWVRHRQNFAGMQTKIVGWSRATPTTSMAASAEVTLSQLHDYADRLRPVHMDCEDACTVVKRYGKAGVFIYEDPPYHMESRVTDFGYQHEMSEEQHIALFEANDAASKAGALIMVSGYGGPFYDRIYKDWRRVEFERPNVAANADEGRITKTEVLWMNYPESLEIGQGWQPHAQKPKTGKEKALLAALRKKGLAR